MDNNIFGKQLNFLRRDAGLSQQELVDVINNKYGTKINRTTISKWENGTQEASMNFVKILADFFGVSLDYLNGLIYDDQQIKKPTSTTRDGLNEITSEIMNVVKQLSPERQRVVLAQAKALEQMKEE